MSIHTREQRQASAVFTKVQLVATERRMSDAEKKQYGGMAHKLPVLIRTAGLVQALEFVAARAEKQRAQKQLLDDLAAVLGHSDSAQLRAEARSAALGPYMRLTQEALETLLWFKRYAQSILEVEDASSADDAATATTEDANEQPPQ